MEICVCFCVSGVCFSNTGFPFGLPIGRNLLEQGLNEAQHCCKLPFFESVIAEKEVDLMYF